MYLHSSVRSFASKVVTFTLHYITLQYLGPRQIPGIIIDLCYMPDPQLNAIIAMNLQKPFLLPIGRPY